MLFQLICEWAVCGTLLQEIEGCNDTIQHISKSAPSMSWMLLSARVICCFVLETIRTGTSSVCFSTSVTVCGTLTFRRSKSCNDTIQLDISKSLRHCSMSWIAAFRTRDDQKVDCPSAHSSGQIALPEFFDRNVSGDAPRLQRLCAARKIDGCNLHECASAGIRL